MRQKLSNIKIYNTLRMSIIDIANIIPIAIANTLKTFMAVTLSNKTYPIGYYGDNLLEFKVNLGTIIATQNFDHLYNVMIRFLSCYNYTYSAYTYFIKFSEEDLIKYKRLCDSFKGKQWNDIVSDFADATYALFSNGIMSDKKLI